MVRARALAALLACLAVLAGVLNTALPATALAVSAGERSVGAAPCAECDQCDHVPCPMPLADCLQAQANAAPTLQAPPVALPIAGYVSVRWFGLHDALSGLSPPPDPFPPRV